MRRETAGKYLEAVDDDLAGGGVTATSTPSRAGRLTVAAPMPRLTPVMRARLFSSPLFMVGWVVYSREISCAA
jgi:hypothetical protein